MYIQLTRNSPQPTDLGQIFVWPAGHPTILIPKPNLRFGNPRRVAGGSSKKSRVLGDGKKCWRFSFHTAISWRLQGWWFLDHWCGDNPWGESWSRVTWLLTRGWWNSNWHWNKRIYKINLESGETNCLCTIWIYVYIIYRFSMVLSAYILFLRTPTWSATNLHWNSKFSQLDIHNSNPKPSDINTSILFVNNPCNGVTPLLWHHKLVPLDLSEIWFEQQRHFLVANDTSAHRIK